MADREPLRAGPLMLRWNQVDHQWQYQMVGGRGHKLAITGFIDKLGERDNAIERLTLTLTSTGYLAQYRSRRRLLARICQNLVDKDGRREVSILVRGGDMGRAAFFAARGKKRHQWAEKLRDV